MGLKGQRVILTHLVGRRSLIKIHPIVVIAGKRRRRRKSLRTIIIITIILFFKHKRVSKTIL